MIIVRDVFKIDPNEMKGGKALAKEHQALLQRLDYPARRIATDLVGEYYTLVMESEFESLAHLESAFQAVGADEEWQSFYPRLRSLLKGGYREILTVVE